MTEDNAAYLAYVKARAAAQLELPALILKKGHHPKDNYDYVELADILVAVNPVLAKHGLVVTFRPSSAEEFFEKKTSQGVQTLLRLSLVARIEHVMGHREELECFGHAGGNKPLAAAYTAARKAGYMSLFALAGGEMEEPEHSSNEDEPSHAGGTQVTDHVPRITTAQAGQIAKAWGARVQKVGSGSVDDLRAILDGFGFAQRMEITIDRYKDVLQAIDAWEPNAWQPTKGTEA